MSVLGSNTKTKESAYKYARESGEFKSRSPSSIQKLMILFCPEVLGSPWLAAVEIQHAWWFSILGLSKRSETPILTLCSSSNINEFSVENMGFQLLFEVVFINVKTSPP